jgi:hypothetical protein
VGYYEGRALMFFGKVRAGFTPALRASVFKESMGSKLIEARSRTCPRRVAVSGAKD